MQGFAIGSGFDGSKMLGSEHNDSFFMENGEVRTRTNRQVTVHTASFFDSPAYLRQGLHLRPCGHLARRCSLSRSGGVQGGLSNGENIVIKVAFKPTSTIAKNQNTVSRDGEDVNLLARGRHDPCVVPRAVPMVEAMVALVLVDQLLQVTVPMVEANNGLFKSVVPVQSLWNMSSLHSSPTAVKGNGLWLLDQFLFPILVPNESTAIYSREVPGDQFQVYVVVVLRKTAC